jgi:hypothetical protein
VSVLWHFSTDPRPPATVRGQAFVYQGATTPARLHRETIPNAMPARRPRLMKRARSGQLHFTAWCAGARLAVLAVQIAGSA